MNKNILLSIIGLLSVSIIKIATRERIKRNLPKMDPCIIQAYKLCLSNGMLLLFVNLFLANNCGPYRSHMVKCAESGRYLELLSDEWPAIIIVLDWFFFTHIVSVLFLVFCGWLNDKSAALPN